MKVTSNTPHYTWYRWVTEKFYYIWFVTIIVNILFLIIPESKNTSLTGSFACVGIYSVITYATYRAMKEKMKEL